ncbi:DNA translocase FtsK 4TM domain-containing protein [Crenobacter sp. SG2305]|uniref:DNA translocase FtsK n=1 Tax=Crenobacter oryzisoli TaxID=3056844 RepID=UPI0025AA8F2F|nr:DNA translocase FtsK [Crenobacter sp. SG2305]MDN0081974.1 DNA translocase FtsK 4TM domain-containing protein [Crenobacter sp. SG2305]
MRLFKRKAVVKNSSTPLPPRLVTLLREAWWLLMAVAAVYLVIALFSYSALDPSWSHSSSDPTIRNVGGAFGAWLSDMLLYVFGYSAWWLVTFCLAGIAWGYRRLSLENRGFKPSPIAMAASGGFLMLILSSASLEALFLHGKALSLPLAAGGMFGRFIGGGLGHAFGATGATLLLSVFFAIGFSLFTGWSWLDIMEKTGTWLEETGLLAWQKLQGGLQNRPRKTDKPAKTEPATPAKPAPVEATPEPVLSEEAELDDDDIPFDTASAAPRREPVLSEAAPIAAPVPVAPPKPAKPVQSSLFADPSDNALPGLALLEAPQEQQLPVTPETVEATSRLIEKKLADFGVEVKVVAAYPGPVITRYEIEPAVGVKGAQIVNLMKDLARALSLVSIRVVETIPGKTYMGLELPNPKRQIVRLSEIVGADVYQNSDSKLTMAMGKDIAGTPIVANLAKMPHVLVAGTTGSGKSVAINAMILSLLYKATPAEVRLIMVDPKMLELSIYEGIPHLLAPVVTDMKHAANALNWCVGEMEKRYKLMSKVGVRNLAGFNQKIKEAERAGQKIANPFSLTPETPEPLETLPLIVVVIDELADLMMVAGKKIEELIARLAQKARAAGIHLILATQRPSVDVITGLIKANIPTRIAFQVSSKIDSRTILDQMGAEALLGQGDMLYLPPGTGYPLRVHGAFVADDEVHHVVEYLKTTGEPDYIDGILSGGAEDGGGEFGASGGEGGGEADALYDEAVAIVLKTRKASISSVQRHLRIGYNRAARLIEQMETAGLVSPMETNGNRTVLVPARED